MSEADRPAAEVRASGPVLLFGGCYSNLQATRALFAAARSLGVPPGRIVCTGDVVAYGADAAATVDLVRASGAHVVMGNCEEQLADGAGDCGCGFAPGSACDRLSAAWFAHADATLGADARAWMRGLPRRIDLAIGGRRLSVVHGGPRAINAFVFASAPDNELLRMIRDAGCDGVVGGHCGIPFTRVVDGMLWHNPGAIGMPANDGTSRTWFSVIEADWDAVMVTPRALAYDHAAAADAMRAAGLPAGYADALGSGLWPSRDVLPPEELALTGWALDLKTTRWSTV